MHYLKPSVLSLCLALLATSCIIDRDIPDTDSELSSSTAVLSSAPEIDPIQSSSQIVPRLSSYLTPDSEQPSSSFGTPPSQSSSSYMRLSSFALSSQVAIPVSSSLVQSASSSSKIVQISSSSLDAPVSSFIPVSSSSLDAPSSSNRRRYSSRTLHDICPSIHAPVCAYDPTYGTIDTLPVYQLKDNACIARQEGLKVTENKFCEDLYKCPNIVHAFMVRDVQQCEPGYSFKAINDEWGCASKGLCEKIAPKNQTLVLNKLLTIKVGETLISQDTDTQLTLDSLKDSRCPKGVQCMLAGNAQLFFTLTEGTQKESVELNTDRVMGNFKPALQYILVQKGLAPSAPDLLNPIISDYEATIAIVLDRVTHN
ncbi:MAG: hypothetical protein OCC49_05685 [Fibrobacterales bacterium]